MYSNKFEAKAQYKRQCVNGNRTRNMDDVADLALSIRVTMVPA